MKYSCSVFCNFFIHFEIDIIWDIWPNEVGCELFRFTDQKNTIVHVVENLDDPKDKDSDILSDH